MEIVIGDYGHSIKMETDSARTAIALDKHEKLNIVLGINRVQVAYINGSWTLIHGANVVDEILPQSNDAAFFKPGTDMVVLNAFE